MKQQKQHRLQLQNSDSMFAGCGKAWLTIWIKKLKKKIR